MTCMSVQKIAIICVSVCKFPSIIIYICTLFWYLKKVKENEFVVVKTNWKSACAKFYSCENFINRNAENEPEQPKQPRFS